MKIYANRLSERIRRNDLRYNEDVDGFDAEDGNRYIQIQDRESASYRPGERHPRTSSNSWGRIWDDNNLERQFEGSKYEVRKEMADYLDTVDASDDLPVMGYAVQVKHWGLPKAERGCLDLPEDPQAFEADMIDDMTSFNELDQYCIPDRYHRCTLFATAEDAQDVADAIMTNPYFEVKGHLPSASVRPVYDYSRI